MCIRRDFNCCASAANWKFTFSVFHSTPTISLFSHDFFLLRSLRILQREMVEIIITWNYTCCEKGLWVICIHIESDGDDDDDGRSSPTTTTVWVRVYAFRLPTLCDFAPHIFSKSILFSFRIYSSSVSLQSDKRFISKCCGTNIVVYGQRISLTWLKFRYPVFFLLSSRFFRLAFRLFSFRFRCKNNFCWIETNSTEYMNELISFANLIFFFARSKNKIRKMSL